LCLIEESFVREEAGRQNLPAIKRTCQEFQSVFNVIARIVPKSEHHEAVKAALLGMIPATLAEPGCRVFTLLEGPEELWLFEEFDDEAALNFHLEQDYTKAVSYNYPDWLEEPVEAHFPQRISPLLGL
jgi:quinol monooxygenase YgiN